MNDSLAPLAKQIATEFFRWWYNQPGANTDDGFDEWWLDNAGRFEGAQPVDFDEWAKNPYTLVLQKSIAEDYVPKHDARPVGAGPEGLIALTERMPNPDEHDRVLIYTHGVDFAGEQFFDVKAEKLNEHYYNSPEEQPELYLAATHWMPLPPEPEVATTPTSSAVEAVDSVLAGFERFASKLVPNEYANGYREAIEHVRRRLAKEGA